MRAQANEIYPSGAQEKQQSPALKTGQCPSYGMFIELVSSREKHVSIEEHLPSAKTVQLVAVLSKCRLGTVRFSMNRPFGMYHTHQAVFCLTRAAEKVLLIVGCVCSHVSSTLDTSTYSTPT